MPASILYLSYDGLTSHIGQSQIIPYIEGLAKRGHRFSVVSFETSDGFETLGEKVLAEAAGVRVDDVVEELTDHALRNA